VARNRRSGFEQPERQEEDDKHTTKPETRKNEVRFCCLIFASIEDMYGPNGTPFCTSYLLGDTADLIFRNGAGALNHARTEDTGHARVSKIRPSRMSFVGLWEAKIQRSVMEGEAVGVIILADVINDQYRVFLTTTGYA
jgi:hypothetical protein